MLGHPEAALADTDHALNDARELGQTATLMYALANTSYTHTLCGNYAATTAQCDELVARADELVARAREKGAVPFKAQTMLVRGLILAVTGKATDVVQMIAPGVTAWRSAGATLWMPLYLSCLATAHAQLGQFDDAWRRIDEAMNAVETTKETWWEAEVNRAAGEVALMGPHSDAAKAEAYIERALTVARQQQAKSWELRAAMSLARLWRDQGKREGARELLAPVYGWFTEGFDTRDLKEAKALLDELAI
jgi:predicted ATPase